MLLQNADQPPSSARHDHPHHVGTAFAPISVQVGGRIEQYSLSTYDSAPAGAAATFTFDSTAILVDPKVTRSQRIFTISADTLHYELNMATHLAPDFQNHLMAGLKRVSRQ